MFYSFRNLWNKLNVGLVTMCRFLIYTLSQEAIGHLIVKQFWYLEMIVFQFSHFSVIYLVLYM